MTGRLGSDSDRNRMRVSTVYSSGLEDRRKWIAGRSIATFGQDNTEYSASICWQLRERGSRRMSGQENDRSSGIARMERLNVEVRLA